MDILDIAIAKQLAGGGGGSGTDNYNDLSNLPKINDVTLSGNKSSSALGLQSEITSENKLDSDLIDDTDQDNKFVTSSEKNTWNGKQNAIDADHKLNADYVDDSTSTNKFVTASDKEAWNAKQNAIDNSHKLSSDLVDDANHTNKFVTSTEKSTWNAKQNAIDSEHKLSSSLVSFTTAEAAALASGIDSEKVAQISTNQTNILLVQNKVGKNLLNPYTPDVTNYDTCRGITYTNNKDGTWYVAGTSTRNDAYIDLYNNQTVLPWGLKTGDTIKVTTNSTKVNVAIIPYTSSGYGSTVAGNASTVGTLTLTSDIKGLLVRFQVGVSGTVTNENIIGMVCHEGAWNQNSDIELYGAPNYDLTYLEAEDRAALAEEIDAGAKNLVDWRNTVSFQNVTIDNGTYTTSGDTLTVLRFQVAVIDSNGGQIMAFNGNGTVPTANGIINIPFTIPTGTVKIRAGHNGSTYNGRFDIPLSGTTLEAGKSYVLQVNVTQYTNSSGIFKWKDLMVATKAAFDVSHKYVPYRPNWDLVVATKAPALSTTSKTSGSLDDIAENSFYFVTDGTTGRPVSEYGFVRTSVFSANVALQEFISFSGNATNSSLVYVRVKQAGTWQSWKLLTNA